MLFLLALLQPADPAPINWSGVAAAVAEIIIAAGVIAVAVRGAIAKVRAELGAKIDENTAKTDAVQKTATELEKQFKQESAMYLLERFETLMQLHPECRRCLEKIRADVFDPLRVQRKAERQEPRP